jgi:sec-independent protein translocase protein TatC
MSKLGPHLRKDDTIALPKYKLIEHLAELKFRLTIIAVFFILSFLISYYYSEYIFQFLLKPLAYIIGPQGRKIIYTGLAEAFFTYINLSAFTALLMSIPLIASQIYLFIKPALYSAERKIAMGVLFFSPILFFIGSVFVFYFVIPKAWEFFLSFEIKGSEIPLLLEARISEYLSLVIKLVLAFGLAFQMPVVLVILALFGIISHESLRKKRRIAIVVNFIIAGIITPPDILSQVALAIPMVLLYELSIIACKYISNRSQHARHKMD